MSPFNKPLFVEAREAQHVRSKVLVDPETGTEWYVELRHQTEGHHGHEVDAWIGIVGLRAWDKGGLTESQAIQKLQEQAESFARAKQKDRE